MNGRIDAKDGVPLLSLDDILSGYDGFSLKAASELPQETKFFHR